MSRRDLDEPVTGALAARLDERERSAPPLNGPGAVALDGLCYSKRNGVWFRWCCSSLRGGRKHMTVETFNRCTS